MTQEEAFEILVSGKNALITGQAGTGKTYLLNQFIQYLNKNQIKVGITASTGIAATHLGGATIHSWSGMGIKDHMTPAEIKKMFTKNKAAIKRIQEASVLIIDEISMLHDYQLDLLDEICRRVRTELGPFGGLQVVLCGDFFQLPPVSKVKNRGNFVNLSTAWQQMNLHVCYLDKQYRQTENNSLHKILNEIRESRVSDESVGLLSERLNFSFDETVIPTKLYTHNTNVDTYNESRLNTLEGVDHLFEMKDSGEGYIVTQMRKGCLAPETLRLRKGAVVMFVFNNPTKNYVNGTTGVVTDFDIDTGYPVVETFRGDTVLAAPMRWGSDEIGSDDWIEQIPLRLAWAITIHKSQGMTLDYAEIDLSRSFTYGLGYVALSRVRDIEGLSLLGYNEMSLLTSAEAQELDLSLRNS